jgi:DNA processing protein
MTAGGGEVSGEVRLARAWLSRAVEPGSVAMWQFVTEAGPVVAAAALRAGRAPREVQALVGARAQEDQALDDLARVQRCGGRLVVPEDAEWPAAALHCLTLQALAQQAEDGARPRDRTRSLVPPLALWVCGDRPMADVVDRSVALVGSRASTAYGEHVAAELAHGLGERGWTTVSGGAFGIDAAAHRGSLAAGAPTVVVLACGVDRAYPSGHSALFARVLDDGLLVSEWPLG